MSFDDHLPGAEHVELMTASRGEYRPRHSNPWRDPEAERDEYLELLSEEIRAKRDHLAHLPAEIADLERKYEEVRTGTLAPLRPEPDPRLSPSMGTDEREEWRAS